jgi:hypothetical protein
MVACNLPCLDGNQVGAEAVHFILGENPSALWWVSSWLRSSRHLRIQHLVAVKVIA